MKTVYVCPTCNVEHPNFDDAADCHNAAGVFSEERMEPGEAERDEEVAVHARIKTLVNEVDQLSQIIGDMRARRGVPTEMTYRRLRKAREYLGEARDYWEYDVIRKNGKQTADDRNRAANYELS